MSSQSIIKMVQIVMTVAFSIRNEGHKVVSIGLGLLCSYMYGIGYYYSGMPVVT